MVAFSMFPSVKVNFRLGKRAAPHYVLMCAHGRERSSVWVGDRQEVAYNILPIFPLSPQFPLFFSARGIEHGGGSGGHQPEKTFP